VPPPPKLLCSPMAICGHGISLFIATTVSVLGVLLKMYRDTGSKIFQLKVVYQRNFGVNRLSR